MKVTVEALEGLRTEMISPLHEHDTVRLQNWKRILVNILSQFLNKEHDLGHAYLLEDKECFQKCSGLGNAELPAVPTRPIRNDAPGVFWEYTFYLDIYNEHMDINCAAVAFLRKLFPSGLVGLEVGYNQLPTSLMVSDTYKHLTSMAKEPTINTEAAIKLQVAGYNMTYPPGRMGPTIFF